MVRCVRTCATCHVRFIAFAFAPVCENCVPVLAMDQVEQVKSNASKPSSEAASTASSSSEDVEKSTAGSEDGYQDDGSEGHDDILCTQLLEDEYGDTGSYQEETPSPAAELGANVDLSKKSTVKEQTLSQQKVPTTSAGSTPKDVCFICGASLQKMKHRVDHIKRCAKKHNISGRDVQLNTDIRDFSDAPDAANAGCVLNPYLNRGGKAWHGDASLALRLAKDDTSGNTSAKSTASVSSTTSSGKQSSLTSFLNNPVRNLNNVLIAGARRMTKTAAIESTRGKQSEKEKSSSRGRKRGRGSWNNAGSSSYGSQESCPMYKKIPGTDFVCDGFHYGKSSLSNNYFLTHFHSDHYGGITKSWDKGVIYCSEATAKLVAQQLGVDMKHLHPLPMNVTTVIETKGKAVNVTLIDANHCPGAVMFLFEVGKRTILHVGDFRWDRDFMMQNPPLRRFHTGAAILDELFLDTTYCDPKYSLPSQATAIGAILNIFENESKICKERKSRTLHLFGAYTIGKEKMYLAVAEKFNQRVYVDKQRYRILSALGWSRDRMAMLTTNREESDIWVVPLGHINMKNLPDYFPQANSKPFAKQYDRIFGYRPTGWSMGSRPSSSLVSTRKSNNIVIHSVPYSEHSSFPELLDCLGCLKPQRIVPTVNAKKSNEQIEILLKGLREKQTKLTFCT